MNNNTHPCANKCGEFKEGGQCFYCLINETVNQGVYSMHRTEHRIDHIVEVNDMVDDTHIENHISPLIERLKVENVVLQAKVDELQAENKILNQAAATHLRNQNHYMDLYHRLIEQLYPYAIDLEEPVGTAIGKEYCDGYNRARAFIHYNLLEMMESDVEYICAQCDMLGGGGGAV